MDTRNNLAKARKTRKSPGTLGLKGVWPGKLWVKKMFIHFIADSNPKLNASPPQKLVLLQASD